MWPFRRNARRGRPESDDRGGSVSASGRQTHRDLGPLGEKLARKFLRRRRYRILARNYRCPAGEIDLIALDTSTRAAAGRETIVFVEVKTRSSDRHTEPQSAVNADKQRRIRDAAGYYLRSRPTGGFAVRFDVLAIVAGPSEEPRITHIPDAFH